MQVSLGTDAPPASVRPVPGYMPAGNVEISHNRQIYFIIRLCGIDQLRADTRSWALCRRSVCFPRTFWKGLLFIASAQAQARHGVGPGLIILRHVQVGNDIELDTVGRQFQPYRWRPCGLTGRTWDASAVPEQSW